MTLFSSNREVLLVYANYPLTQVKTLSSSGYSTFRLLQVYIFVAVVHEYQCAAGDGLITAQWRIFRRLTDKSASSGTMMEVCGRDVTLR